MPIVFSNPEVGSQNWLETSVTVNLESGHDTVKLIAESAASNAVNPVLNVDRVSIDPINHCDASAAPLNGVAGDCTNELPYGDFCQPGCDAGFTVSGQTTCSDEGQLTAANCSANGCNLSILPSNALDRGTCCDTSVKGDVAPTGDCKDSSDFVGGVASEKCQCGYNCVGFQEGDILYFPPPLGLELWLGGSTGPALHPFAPRCIPLPCIPNRISSPSMSLPLPCPSCCSHLPPSSSHDLAMHLAYGSVYNVATSLG